MTSPTGNELPPVNVPHRLSISLSRAFTLVELILVMAILGAVLGAAAPALSRFFQGRTLHSEARRFLSLTHYAQNRAVAEGAPMVLWINPTDRTYGLRAESSYATEDVRAVQFELAQSIVIEPDLPLRTSAPNSLGAWRQTAVIARNQPALRFTPDGFIDPISPERIVIREEHLGEISIVQSRTRLHYEIQTNTTAHWHR